MFGQTWRRLHGEEDLSVSRVGRHVFESLVALQHIWTERRAAFSLTAEQREARARRQP